jgi:hypothetical protein
MTNAEAIEQLKHMKVFIGYDAESPMVKEMQSALDLAIKALEIELLTDTEQRIFLKAISREREVCQKVDDEYSDDDSKVSLVKVCNSIERKVKKIWE